MSVFKLSYLACNAHCHIVVCGLPRCTKFCTLSHEGHDFIKKSYWTKNVFWFRLQLLSETFLILRRTERYKIKSVHESACKVPVFLVQFCRKLCFIDRVSKNTPISNSMKILSLGAELFHVDRRTGGQIWRG